MKGRDDYSEKYVEMIRVMNLVRLWRDFRGCMWYWGRVGVEGFKSFLKF